MQTWSRVCTNWCLFGRVARAFYALKKFWYSEASGLEACIFTCCVQSFYDIFCHVYTTFSRLKTNFLNMYNVCTITGELSQLNVGLKGGINHTPLYLTHLAPLEAGIKLPLSPVRNLWIQLLGMTTYCTEAGFLDETQTKVFRVFFLVIHSHLSAVQTCINRYTVQTHRGARYVQQSRLEDANISEMFFFKKLPVILHSWGKKLNFINGKARDFYQILRN
jgi:hypothetical protein